MNNEDYKSLPHSEETEKTVLGAILLDNELITQAAELLQPNDFYHWHYRHIFRAMLELAENRNPIDPILIGEELKKAERGQVIGVAEITQLTYGIPHFSDIKKYADILKENSLKRSVIKETNNLLMNVTDTENIKDLLNRYSEKFKKLSEKSGSNENLGFTFGELATLDLPPREEIMFGLGRGEVGIMNAVNNAGKTTVLRNLMVSLCTGKSFPPFGNFNLPKRVAFLDFEDSLSFLRNDLSKMLWNFTDADKARVNDNALLICDARINDEELSLSNSLHLFSITNRLRSFAPDLIIVDTISSAFQIRDENNNAEVRKFITRPLKTLAKDCNAALIASHHIGKAKIEEGYSKEASHKGRGASSFADMSRLVLNLEKDGVDETVKLICAKVKGTKFTDLKLKLNSESRWFEAIGESREVTNFSLLMEMFSDGKMYSTKDVVEEFDGVMSERLVKSNLNQAVKRNDLRKVRHGIYQDFTAWQNAGNGESAKVQIV